MSEKIKRDVREVSNFTKVDLRGAGTIELTQGDAFQVIIEAEEHILERLTSEVDDGTLILDIEKSKDKKGFKTDEAIIYSITMPVVEGIRIAGGGKVNADTLTGKSFALDLPGGANVKIERIEVDVFTTSIPGGAKITVNEVKSEATTIQMQGSGNINFPQLETEILTVNIQGAGNIDVQGSARQQTINMFGVSNYKAGMLRSEQATVHAPGLANATLWVTDTLVVNLTGMGNIRYYGEAKVTSTIRGMGRVKHLGDSPLEKI
jgi:Putative auto-transporter adhesin, head GIN domain